MMNSTMANYRESPLLFMIYEESESWLSAKNKARLDPSGSSQSKCSAGGQPSAERYGPGNGQNGPPTFEGGEGSHPRESSGWNSSASWSYGGSSPTASSTTTSSTAAPVMGAPSAPTPSLPSDSTLISNTTDLWSGNYTVWHPQVVNLADAGQFEGAPSFYTMNGYILSNNLTFEMCQDDKAVWYTNAYGSMSHVFHMHGNSFVYNGMTNYAVSLNDGVGKTLFMNSKGVGKWQVVCHVSLAFSCCFR